MWQSSIAQVVAQKNHSQQRNQLQYHQHRHMVVPAQSEMMTMMIINVIKITVSSESNLPAQSEMMTMMIINVIKITNQQQRHMVVPAQSEMMTMMIINISKSPSAAKATCPLNRK
ncbi:hypothetical protein DPMN_063508 [Dreissena polymorpha]|uniref:Uncharacterized protein n=1 Tax=Dreissena polymorpha TaxID=45954 RepID=A0A9D4CAN1_DREPO|nr:hypothetical protein DPMN_063508 [Dreissena polymorpha]